MIFGISLLILVIYLMESSLFLTGTQVVVPTHWNTSEHSECIPLSAILEPDGKSVRIYVIKTNRFYMNHYCFFIPTVTSSKSPSLSDVTKLQYASNKTHTSRILPGTAMEYLEQETFCDIPANLQPDVHSGQLSIGLTVEGFNETTILPIRLGLVPKLLSNSTVTFKHEVAICFSPWFNTNRYSVNYLVEYMELQRNMGASLFIFYMTENPADPVRVVLESYRKRPSLGHTDHFQMKVLQWRLPLSNPGKQTWSHAQIINYNECLFRYADQAEYILYADLDEIVVTKATLKPPDGLAKWPDIIRHIKRTPILNTSTVCFLSRFFPDPRSNKIAMESSVFARNVATEVLDPKRTKCLVRSGTFKQMYIHWPLDPPKTIFASDVATILHYRDCVRNGLKPCASNTAYRENTELQPYRKEVETMVASRLRLIKMFSRD
ncbi:hypothetical protein EG68_04668 [Paragonimus skrjabini miyazakii]|uniref:Glycosyltransferase family 92 protein n=1 Tax=Paragonimus skrjabini miyazakii TaxID=59628 RepID=A0A8S9YRX1_9TREM|nr:hypothetical protein EG68_04668 [Paragonimus skrjabini miyazakii]